MASSGTWSFALSNASVLIEAFDRIQMEATTLTPHHMASGRLSLNLELLTWSNQGFNFWETTSGTINLVASQVTYTLPASTVTLTELWYSQVNALGSGSNSDRLLLPMQRSEYAAIVNKSQPGIPTRYWYQMLATPQVNIWQPPAVGAPSYVLNWYGLRQVQDANITNGETPDIAYRAIDALISGLARRLAEKFKPEQHDAKARIFEVAWAALTRRDQEPGAITYQAQVGRYGRMGG